MAIFLAMLLLPHTHQVKAKFYLDLVWLSRQNEAIVPVNAVCQFWESLGVTFLPKATSEEHLSCFWTRNLSQLSFQYLFNELTIYLAFS